MRKVLVTGSASGIGKAVSELFLNRGYDVVGIDINESSISHPQYRHYLCDVAIVDQLPDLYDDFTYVINSAGTDSPHKAISVNLTSLFAIEDKYINENTECVVNICDTSAHTGADNRSYAASKGGVLAYTKNLAKRMASWGNGGRCVSISPGPVWTPMNEKILGDESKRHLVERENILGRWIQPAEIAEAVWFMCMSRSITGSDLLIDCGEHINHTHIN